MTHPGGRPTDYRVDTALRICDELAHGRPLTKICVPDDMPSVSTVYLWLIHHKEFSEMYTKAREDQADTMADEIVQIADDGLNDTYRDDDGNVRVDHDVIARSRLRVDARKWVAAKLKPRKYGDRQIVEGPGEGGAHIVRSVRTMSDDELMAVASTGIKK